MMQYPCHLSQKRLDLVEGWQPREEGPVEHAAERFPGDGRPRKCHEGQHCPGDQPCAGDQSCPWEGWGPGDGHCPGKVVSCDFRVAATRDQYKALKKQKHLADYLEDVRYESINPACTNATSHHLFSHSKKLIPFRNLNSIGMMIRL